VSHYRLCPLALALVFFTGTMSAPAEAAVVCQKGKKIKIRPAAACKRTETLVADLGVDLSGVWRYREGGALSEGTFVPTFLALNADGTGSLNRRQPATSVLSCTKLRYARGGGVPTLTLQQEHSVSLVGVVTEGSDVLRITDDLGTSVFDRAEQIDPAAECALLTETRRLTDVPVPFSGGGLAFDGTNFVYLNDDFDPVVVNATTGATGSPPTLAGLGRMPYAAEGGDFWGLCGCGGNDVAVRSSVTGTTVDEVRPADFGEPTFLQSLAVPPTGGQLFLLASRGGSAFSARLLLVNTAAEPDTLLTAFDFDAPLGSFAHDGTSLWGLTGRQVVRIDPQTARATGTFLIPDASTDWIAIAAAGGQVFLVGRTSGNEGVIGTFTP